LGTMVRNRNLAFWLKRQLWRRLLHKAVRFLFTFRVKQLGYLPSSRECWHFVFAVLETRDRAGRERDPCSTRTPRPRQRRQRVTTQCSYFDISSRPRCCICAANCCTVKSSGSAGRMSLNLSSTPCNACDKAFPPPDLLAGDVEFRELP